MIKITGYLDAFAMFERNGWNYDLKQSEENHYESVFYYMDITVEYKTRVTAEFVKEYRGLNIASSFGVVGLSGNYEYTDMTFGEIEDMLEAMEHAEDNLLNNGIPFVKNYEFYGKTKKQKALKNQRIRKRMHIDEIEANARKIREKEKGEVNEVIQANDTW